MTQPGVTDIAWDPPSGASPEQLLAHIERMKEHMMMLFRRLESVDLTQADFGARFLAHCREHDAEQKVKWDEWLAKHEALLIQGRRYAFLRQYRVRVAILGINGSELLLDHEVDKAIEEKARSEAQKQRPQVTRLN